MASKVLFSLTIKPDKGFKVLKAFRAKTWLIERHALTDTGKSCQYFHCCSVIKSNLPNLSQKAASLTGCPLTVENKAITLVELSK